MKSSAAKASRKWSCHGGGCDKRPMVTVAVLVLALAACALPAQARSLLRGGVSPEPAHTPSHGLRIPLPRPRPAEAPAAETEAQDGKPAEPGQHAADQAAPAAASPCRLALTDAIAIAPSIPPIHGPGSCGGDDL